MNILSQRRGLDLKCIPAPVFVYLVCDFTGVKMANLNFQHHNFLLKAMADFLHDSI